MWRPGGTGTPTQSPAAVSNVTDSRPYDVPLNGTVVTEGHRAAIEDMGRFRYRQSTTVRVVLSDVFLQYRSCRTPQQVIVTVWRIQKVDSTERDTDSSTSADETAARYF